MENNTVLGVLDNKCVVPIEPFYTYTHTKSGTVHALSGNFGSNIKFTATADYTGGDTFTVNNTPVTAKLQNGGELSNNSFVSGAVVTCFLNGTTLYFGPAGNAINDVTVLFSGTLTGGNFAQLSESIYNFQFIAVKPSSGPDILIPVLPEAKSVAGSVSISVPEAFDTYMFAADIGTDGKLLGDNQNVKVTTVLGNPAQTIYSVYNVTAIYGICRIKSD